MSDDLEGWALFAKADGSILRYANIIPVLPTRVLALEEAASFPKGTYIPHRVRIVSAPVQQTSQRTEGPK